MRGGGRRKGGEETNEGGGMRLGLRGTEHPLRAQAGRFDLVFQSWPLLKLRSLPPLELATPKLCRRASVVPVESQLGSEASCLLSFLLSLCLSCCWAA